MNTVEPIRDVATVHAIKQYLKEKNEKYYIMFITGIYLGLRINEILKMRVGDVKNKTQTVFRQSKTGKECFVAYNKELLSAYKSYCMHRSPDEALIPNPYNEYKAISRVQAYRIIKAAGEKFGVVSLGTHTLRKTCGYHFYQQTHDIATLQIWLNHSSERETLLYIGVTRDTLRQAMINFKI